MADPRQGDFITSVHQILTFSISHDFWLNSQEIFHARYSGLNLKTPQENKILKIQYFQFGPKLNLEIVQNQYFDTLEVKISP